MKTKIMTFRETIMWSPNVLSIEHIKKNPPKFPILVNITSGFYGESDEQSVHADNVMLLHGWGVQERIVARNKSDEAISIPVNDVHKLKYDGSSGFRMSWFKRPVYITTRELLKKHKPPFPAHFEPKKNIEVYDKHEIFNPKEFGKLKVEGTHWLRYLITSDIDDEGAVTADSLGALPEFLDIEMVIAEAIIRRPGFYEVLLDCYKNDTKDIRSKVIHFEQLSKLMGYNDSLKSATPQIKRNDDYDEVSSVSARQLPLPPVPGGRAKFQTFKELCKQRGIIPFAMTPPNIQVNQAPAQGVPNIEPVENQEAALPLPIPPRRPYHVPIPVSSDVSSDSDSDEDEYDDGFSPFADPNHGISAHTVLENGSKPADDYDDGLSPPTPMTHQRMIITNNPKEEATQSITKEIENFFKGGGLKRTNQSSQPQTKELMKTKMPIPPPKPHGLPSKSPVTQPPVSQITRNEPQLNVVSPNMPVARVHPLPCVKSKPIKKSETSLGDQRPIVPLRSTASCVSDMRQNFERQDSESAATSSPGAPEKHNRRRFKSDPLPTILSNQNQEQWGIQSLSNVPKNISNLNIAEIGACLELLNLHHYVERFAQDQVDGNLLKEMDNDDFLDLGMEGFHAKKMCNFIKGWRPNE